MTNDHKNVSFELIVREIDGVIFTEEWRPVVECPTIYHISSFGRLKKLSTKSKDKKKPDKVIPEKIICGGITKKGYVRFIIRYNGKCHSRYGHRLVALAFINLIEGKPDVNHKTGVKLHNHFSQLEWCTPQENNEHGVKMGLLKRGKKPIIKIYKRKEDKKHKPPLKIIDISNGEIFVSIEELCNIKGLNIKNIRRQINGERFCHVSYRYLGNEWKAKMPPVKPPKPVKIPFIRPPKKEYVPHPLVLKKIIMMDINGNEIKVFDSVLLAANYVGSNTDTFRKAIKKSPNNFTKGYIWKYA